MARLRRVYTCCSAAPRTKSYATRPRARTLFRRHYEGCRVWSGVCWGHVLEGYTLEMGRRDGALCTHLEFRGRYSYTNSGLRIYYKYGYGHDQTPLTSHVRAERGARHVRAEKGTARTPPDSPLHRVHCRPISAGTRSSHECNAPANKIRRHSFISNGFTSQADMPPSGNRFHKIRPLAISDGLKGA